MPPIDVAVDMLMPADEVGVMVAMAVSMEPIELLDGILMPAEALDILISITDVVSKCTSQGTCQGQQRRSLFVWRLSSVLVSRKTCSMQSGSIEWWARDTAFEIGSFGGNE